MCMCVWCGGVGQVGGAGFACWGVTGTEGALASVQDSLAEAAVEMVGQEDEQGVGWG